MLIWLIGITITRISGAKLSVSLNRIVSPTCARLKYVAVDEAGGNSEKRYVLTIAGRLRKTAYFTRSKFRMMQNNKELIYIFEWLQ